MSVKIGRTQLQNYNSLSATQINQFLTLCKNQNIKNLSLVILSGTHYKTGLPQTTLAKTKEIINAASGLGIACAIDLHTWYTTWRNDFATSQTNRASYLSYVKNTVTAFNDVPVSAFMLLNEPDVYSMPSPEINQFMRDILAAGKQATNAPCSIRFMAGYTPTSGVFSPDIFELCDFLAINSYWDARAPTVSKYGSTEAKLKAVIATAKAQNKQIWITEFGLKFSAGDANQAEYTKEFLAWSVANGVDVAYAWTCQIGNESAEPYNLLTANITPRAAFKELGETVTEEEPEPMTDKNLASIESGLWQSGFNQVVLATDPETGEPMLVIPKGSPLSNHSPNITEVNTPWLPTAQMISAGIPPLKAGDRVVLISTMKTDGAEGEIANSKYGALMACDGYGSHDRICEISPKTAFDPLTDENYFSKLNIANQSGAPTRWLGFNKGWITQKYSFIVPNRIFELDDYGKPLAVKSPIYGLIGFFGSNWRDVVTTNLTTNPANVYIKRIGIYINPTAQTLPEEIDPYLPPSPPDNKGALIAAVLVILGALGIGLNELGAKK